MYRRGGLPISFSRFGIEEEEIDNVVINQLEAKHQPGPQQQIL